jgi:RNA polymerase sigma-70 factor, ECF subfamily
MILGERTIGMSDETTKDPSAGGRSPEVRPSSDAVLMERLVHGDREAFGDLVERHHQRVLDFAYRMTADPDQARDIAQEVFLRIARSSFRYEPKAPLLVYLLAITRNLVREAGRKRSRRREDPLPDDVPGRSDHDDPVARLERSEIRDRLARALLEIPDRAREVFVLSEIEGLSYEEISRICRCPMGTVASRKHDAVVRLRRLLEPLRGGLS